MDGILLSPALRHYSREKFKVAREKGLFTDIELLVGTGDTCQSFKAHSVFLACGSPVFEDILKRHLYVELNITPITIPDVHPHIFQSFLDHLYGINISFKSVEMALEVYKVADKYLVPGLRTESELYICNCIKIENVLSNLKVSDDNLMTILKQKCIEFIASCLEDIFKHKDFNKITEENFECVLQREDLKASEQQILRAITHWEIANKLTAKERKGQASLIKYVRFNAFKVGDICDLTTEYPSVMQPCDALKIVKHLACPSRYELPEWCSRANSRMPIDNVITARRHISNQ